MSEKFTINIDRTQTTLSELSRQIDLEVALTQKYFTPTLDVQDVGIGSESLLSDICVMPKALVQTILPYTRPVDETGRYLTHLVRASKNVTLTLSCADPTVGIPYGSAARLLIARLTTLAVMNGTTVVELGPNLTALVRSFGKVAGGGERGACTAFQNAIISLAATSVFFHWHGKFKCQDEFFQGRQTMLFPILEKVSMWSRGKDISTAEGVVELSPYFFEEVSNRPVPFIFSKLVQLSKSPMQMDIYLWATYKASYTRGDVLIPWAALKTQFGHNYSRLRDFRAAFLRNLKPVSKLYPGLRFNIEPEGLRFLQSTPDVDRKTSMMVDHYRKEKQAALQVDAASKVAGRKNAKSAPAVQEAEDVRAIRAAGASAFDLTLSDEDEVLMKEPEAGTESKAAASQAQCDEAPAASETTVVKARKPRRKSLGGVYAAAKAKAKENKDAEAKASAEAAPEHAEDPKQAEPANASAPRHSLIRKKRRPRVFREDPKSPTLFGDD